MANRHLSRSIVLQTLFEWDFNGQKAETIKDALARNTVEFGPGLEDAPFMQSLVDTVLRKQKIIDEIIEKAAPDWPIDKISIVDRNILRMGLAELLFGDRTQVPPKVAINEAIELAKTFGGEKSGRFINGVLGAIYKELGEPDKDQISKKKKAQIEIDPSKLPVEKRAGAVIYAREDGVPQLALVHDVFGYWTLAKGHIEEGEDEKTGTVREMKEKLGLSVKIVESLGENEYIASHPEKGKYKKRVYYFLVEAPMTELRLESSGGLDDARWFKLTDLPELKIYDDILPIITKAIEIITK